MKVELCIYDGVVAEGRQTFALDVEPGASVRALAQQVGAPLERIGLVTVDGRVCQVDHLVEADQRICLFPHVMGG